MTMTDHERDAFLRARTAIGASEAAAVLGLDEYNTPADVYDRLVLLLDHDEVDQTPANDDMMRGILFEDLAVQQFEARTGRRTRRVLKADQNSDVPFLRANPDRLILLGGGDESVGCLEVKCPRPQTVDRYRKEGLPDRILIQGLAQLACRPTAGYVIFWIFDVLSPSKSLQIRIDRDDEYIEQGLIPALGNFWNEHVEPRVRPSVSREAYPSPPRLDGSAELDDPELILAMSQYAEALQIEKETKELKAAARKVIQHRLEELEVKSATAGDYRASLTWVVPKQGRVDEKGLRMACLQHGFDMDNYRFDAKPYSRMVVGGR